MSTANLRPAFPGVGRRTFLDSASIGLVSTAARDAIAAFLARAEHDPQGAHHGDAFARARAAAAALIGATPETIALIPSTSLALNIAADAIPLAAGDNVVTTDLEFMSVVVPWVEKARVAGAEIRVARHRDGRIAPDDVIALMDGRTRAVTLSAVQWTNGFRMDVAPIGRACRDRDVPFVLDAIQQIGVVPFDAVESGADFVACGGHKWLCSPAATGFAYVSRRFAERFRPSLSYVPTSRPPLASWQASWTDPAYDPIRTYELKPAAARFEQGVHHGGLGATGLAASLALLLDAGPAAVWDRARSLADRVAGGVAALGLAVVSPLEPAARSGITVFATGRGPAGDLAVKEGLAAAGVDVNVRYTSGVGGVRVSTHAYNDEDDVDRFLDALRPLLAA
jgi:selenocysteine lyase/cysteine desulfurase